MHQAGGARRGTMAAVLGLATAEVEAACREASIGDAVAVPANLNAPDQTVISGDPDAVTRAGDACKRRGAKRVIPLKVSGAFHSSLMAPAANQLRVALEHAPFRDPAFPVVANATAEPVRDATRARRLLADQLTAPVRWVACMQRAAELGGALDGTRFIEIGPGNVLAGDGDRAQQTAQALGDGTGRGYACDVADARQVETVVAAVEQDFGHVDVLVNNAGTTRDNLLFRIGEEDWDTVLDTNLKGAFLVTKHAARGMIKRRWGRIVNITSVVGIAGNKGQSNYTASKAGLIGFTKAVSKELASRNVLVNAVAPGFIDTELTRAITGEAREALIGAIPLGRLGEGREVAAAVLFLASDFASYITGQVLVVDGGMVL